MFKDAEKRVNKYGTITYWKNGLMVGKRCTKCGEDKEICEFGYSDKKKGYYRAECKKCYSQHHTQWYEANKEHMKEYGKQYRETNKEHIKEKHKQWYENNPEYSKQYYQSNKERYKEYCQNNKEYIKEREKQYRENNKEYIKERSKQYYQNNKQSNLQYISSLLDKINPILKDLPTYGYVYMFENVKTGHKYVGQSTQPIAKRYRGIVQGWIEERSKYDNQKFKEELIEEDIVVTEVLDVAFCQYHLDKLEAYYIDKYDSYNNGYNNQAGNHNTNDGLEEFNKILENNGLKFVDGKIITI